MCPLAYSTAGLACQFVVLAATSLMLVDALPSPDHHRHGAKPIGELAWAVESCQPCMSAEQATAQPCVESICSAAPLTSMKDALQRGFNMKTLIAYYSRTGHTEQVAKEIAARCQADVDRIRDDGVDRSGLWGYLCSGWQAFSVPRRPSTERPGTRPSTTWS